MNAISQISSEMSAALALDLASEIWTEADVFSNHGVDPVYGAALLRTDWFRNMVADYKREWGSIANAKQRIKAKSQIVVEESIEHIYKIVADNSTPAAARVAAFKELKDISGVSGVDAESGGASGPVVNIFLEGNDGPAISISSTAKKRDSDIIEIDADDVTPSNFVDDSIGMAPL